MAVKKKKLGIDPKTQKSFLRITGDRLFLDCPRCQWSAWGLARQGSDSIVINSWYVHLREDHEAREREIADTKEWVDSQRLLWQADLTLVR